jgi:hypothetical protein
MKDEKGKKPRGKASDEKVVKESKTEYSTPKKSSKTQKAVKVATKASHPELYRLVAKAKRQIAKGEFEDC